MPTPIRKPMRPLNEMIRLFAEQADERMQVNLQTQRIWPTEVYPGYAKINAEREAKGWSHSTGEGAKSFRFIPHTADNIGEAQIDVTFNNYLRYVDLGVGAGRHAADIPRNRKADFDKRYNKWNVPKRKTHRPAIMMELRHVLQRMRDYAVDFYGYEGTGYLIKTFDGLEIGY